MPFVPADYSPPPGALLREVRGSLNLTQQESADAAGVSRRSWVRYEQEEISIQRPALLAFCYSFDIDPVIFGLKKRTK